MNNLNIYELIKNGETVEFKSTGHVDACRFAKKIKLEFDFDINIGDIKHGYEQMTFKRNRNQTKPGEIYFKRCAASDFGANPVTFVRIK